MKDHRHLGGHSTGVETGIPRKGGYVPNMDLDLPQDPMHGVDNVRHLWDIVSPPAPSVGTPALCTTRTFATGATRDSDLGKLDFEGFLHPVALLAFAQYMHKHRFQSDGTLRASDNWQKGIPPEEYLKSMLRHVVDLWLIMRGHPNYARENIMDALCGIYFNCAGLMVENYEKVQTDKVPDPAPVASKASETHQQDPECFDVLC